VQEIFGKYVLRARIASGGMGEIFLATLDGAAGFRKLVVVKRLLPHIAEDPRFVAMFLDEARLAARLAHPHVCTIYELGEVSGRYFIAMEYLEGVTLHELVHSAALQTQPLAMGVVAAVMQGICEGLHHAHELRHADGRIAGVVHRDVSPSNLFVLAQGLPKVLDFGIAKSRDRLVRTTTGTVRGKYAYMSPEQIAGEAVDRRSDVFAAGVVLHEALTGRPLFERETDFLIYKAILQDPIPRVGALRDDVPEAVSDVVARALARRPEERFASARELGEALAAAVAPFGGAASAQTVAVVVEGACAAELERRRALVRQIEHAVDEVVVPAPAAAAPIAAPTPGRASVPAAATPARPPRGSTAPPASRRRLRYLTLALLVAVPLAIYTWRALATPPQTSALPPAPVLLTAGDVVVTPAAAPAAPADAAPAPPLARTADVSPAATLSRLFSATSGAAVSACMLRFRPPADAPTLSIAFELEPDGRVRNATLSPARLAATDVGRCILAVARATRFGPQRHLRFAIPLEVQPVK
jgi:hypothetical protein